MWDMGYPSVGYEFSGEENSLQSTSGVFLNQWFLKFLSRMSPIVVNNSFISLARNVGVEWI